MHDILIDKNYPRFQKFARYFGFGLSERNLDLEIVVPVFNHRLEKPETSSEIISAEFKEIRKSPNAVLKKLDADLKRLNKYPITHARRVQLSTVYWHTTFLLVQKFVTKYEKFGRLPDDSQRAMHLDQSFRILDLIRKSYQLIFLHYYKLSNWRYGRQRKFVFNNAFRIFEVLQLQQKIGALRYRALPHGAWLTSNKIYHAMREFENVNEIQLLTVSLIAPDDKKLYDSINGLYLRIQLFGFLDPLRYPSVQQSLLDGYLKAKTKNIVLSTIEHASVSCEDKLYLTHSREKVASLKTNVIADELPGTEISLSSIRTELLSIKKQFCSPRNDEYRVLHRSENFASMKKESRIPLFRILYSQIFNPPQSLSFMSGKRIDLLFYSGFMDCYDLIQDDKRAKSRRRELLNKLAERSSLFGEDEKAGVDTQWTCLYSDRQTLLLQTKESQITLPMSVGCLVAFLNTRKSDVNHTFAYVARFERLRDSRVNIELKILAEHAEAVSVIVVVRSREQDQRKRYPAFLFRDNDHWHVLMHNSYVHRRLLGVVMKRNGKLYQLTLGKRLYITVEFSVFRLGGRDVDKLATLHGAVETTA